MSSMGPAAFAWPLSREWNRTTVDVPPCGLSVPGQRSKFPLHNGYVVFLSKYETQNLELRVSYLSRPQSVADFEPLVQWRISRYGVGFVCVKIPDAPQGMDSGANATFQLRLASDYDTPNLRSFFVCADITYVERDELDYPFPCVNTTDADFERLPSPPKKTEPPEPTPTWSPGEKDKGLKSPHFAGIAIGGLVVLSGIVVGILYMLQSRRDRRRRQEEVPCRWVPGSYGLPDAVPVGPSTQPFFYARPTRRG